MDKPPPCPKRAPLPRGQASPLAVICSAPFRSDAVLAAVRGPYSVLGRYLLYFAPMWSWEQASAAARTHSALEPCRTWRAALCGKSAGRRVLSRHTPAAFYSRLAVPQCSDHYARFSVRGVHGAVSVPLDAPCIGSRCRWPCVYGQRVPDRTGAVSADDLHGSLFSPAAVQPRRMPRRR